MGLRHVSVVLLALAVTAALGCCVLLSPVIVAGPGETAAALGVEVSSSPEGEGAARITLRNRGPQTATIRLTAWSAGVTRSVTVRQVVVGYDERVVCDGEVCRIERVPILVDSALATETPADVRLSRYRILLAPEGVEHLLLTVADPGSAEDAVVVTLGLRVRAGEVVVGAWLVTAVPVSLAPEPSVP